MKRTTDEMIYILSEYARTHKDEIRDFDDLTPYIAEHPEIFGKKAKMFRNPTKPSTKARTL